MTQAVSSTLLPPAFYQHEAVVEISRALLGKFIVTNFANRYTAGMIVETEAYAGPQDKAAHSYGNRRTLRTSTLFMGGGITYIYVCYGIHHLMNVVTGPPEMPHGVLIRGIEPVEGVDIMLARRQLPYLQHRLTAGPGSLTQALGISRVHNGFALTGNSPIWIEDRKIVIPSRCIMQSPRVGVGYAQEHQYRPWRFRIKNNSWTSPAK